MFTSFYGEKEYARVVFVNWNICIESKHIPWTCQESTYLKQIDQYWN